MWQSTLPDVICLSHLRWNFVFQRPQHLMTRWADHARVFYVEEPVLHDDSRNFFEVDRRHDRLSILTPHLSRHSPSGDPQRIQASLLQEFVAAEGLRHFVLWYYTPMALPIARELAPRATVYDCMDQLSAFHGAPQELPLFERQLLEQADVVMAGGYSLYRAKRKIRGDVHLFPSSVDVEHFQRARHSEIEPLDQKKVPHPRIGFFGVIDERMDLDLVEQTAALRPDWHFVFIGPVAKIDPASLPVAANIHYLGQKSYAELPDYVAGWDVAILPFARNESTRFISPTKTPEYLAAGCPVVATSISDVVEPYGRLGLAQIADTPRDFVREIARALASNPEPRRAQSDAFLAGNSWDTTFASMASLVELAIRAPRRPFPARRNSITAVSPLPPLRTARQ